MAISVYRDGSRIYLELHALRAPVGDYISVDPDDYDLNVQCAIEDFETDNDVEIYQLGRSGRHICVENTPRNRDRYTDLQEKAIHAARAMWADMQRPR